MKIHEFQAKELLRNYGVAVPDGDVARTPEEAEKIATTRRTNITISTARDQGIHTPPKSSVTFSEVFY